MNRVLRMALLTIAGLLAAVALGLGGFALRLSKGPIPLDFLTPRILHALRAQANSVQVTLGSTMLAWDTQERRLDLRLNDVRLAQADGTPIVTIPGLAIWPSLTALLRGRIELVRVEVLDPQLWLTRQADGNFKVALASAAADGSADAATSLVAGALGGSGDATVAKLPFDTIAIRNAILTLTDQASGYAVHMEDVDCEVRRDAAGVVATLAAMIGGGPARATLHGNAAYAVAADVLTLDNLRLNLDTAAIQARATVDNVRGAARVQLDVSSAVIPMDERGRYWPTGMAEDARAWVVGNISVGQARNVTAHLGAHVDGDGGGLVVDQLAGGGTFDNLSVRYLGSMPPVTNVAGTATFSPGTAHFAVSGGTVGAVNVVRGAVAITGFDGVPRISIDTRVQGAMNDVLSVLANPPFTVPQRTGIVASDARGNVDAQLQFDFPLQRPLARDQLTIGVTGALQAVAFPIPQRLGWQVSDGNFRLAIDDDVLHIVGPLRVRVDGAAGAATPHSSGSSQGVPIELAMSQDLLRGQHPDIELRAQLDQPERAALQIDPGTWLSGPLAVTAHVFAERDGTQRLAFDVNFHDAALDIPLVPKRRGDPGDARGEVVLGGGGVTVLDGIKFTTPRVSISGTARRSAEGIWDTADLEAVISPPGGAGGRGRAHLTLHPAGGAESFTLTSGDAGMLLRSFGYSHATGGNLSFVGTVRLREPDPPVDGELELDRFNVVRAPVLAQIAGLASVRGIVQSLQSGGGIRFDRAHAGVSYARRVVTIREGAARGPSLAIFLDGTISQATEMVDLSGRLIPSLYGINEAPSKIPIIGKVLTGGSDRALATFDFRVSGRASAPDVHVSDVQSIAPTVVHDLLRKVW